MSASIEPLVLGAGQLPVQKANSLSLRQMAAEASRLAMASAGIETVDAVFASSMLASALQAQGHLAALIADELGLEAVEAVDVRAATAAGAACLRAAALAVRSGEIHRALVVGVEKMSEGEAKAALLHALDAEQEIPRGETMLTRNAQLMRAYFDRYSPPPDGLTHFSVNAHRNAATNPNAMFQSMQFDSEAVLESRIVEPPLRLYDCSPICDGAAAIVLAHPDAARDHEGEQVRLIASGAATDRFRVDDRPDPLALQAGRVSAERAYQRAKVTAGDIDLFEVHDAFSIMACLSLEAAGFAVPGEGWRLAAEGAIGLTGRIPISTFGGLKARGHPIGATALYQAGEIWRQLTGKAGANQVAGAKLAMTQSVGGAATTIVTHIFGI